MNNSVRVRVGGNPRGIYLVTTLLLLTFLVMVGGALMVSFQQGIASSSTFNNRQMALDAAMAGVEYIQARIETSVGNYSPFVAPSPNPFNASCTGNSFQVYEYQEPSGGVNVCGVMNNSPVIGAHEQQINIAFRASFNTSYTAYAATPTDWSFVHFSGWPVWSFLPTMGYVSMNNLTRSTSQTSYTYYSNGSSYKAVPGGVADIIVEGMVVSPDGTSVVLRRCVEAQFSIGSFSSMSASASAAKNVSLNMYDAGSAGGSVSISSTVGNGSGSGSSGVAAYSGSVSVSGLDAATSTKPADYTSLGKASVSSGQDMTYTQYNTSGATVATTTYNPTSSLQNVVQVNPVPPPQIATTALPAQTSPSSLSAGTWVVYNNSVYHYPVDYANPTTVPLNSQPFAAGTGSPPGPPTYNGVSPDSASLPSGMSFDATTNTITVSSDVLVAPSASPAATGFAFVVAPAATTNNTSDAIGSAQIVMTSTSGSTPQVQASGAISVMGNVTGQGSLTTTGTSSDVTVIGNSSLDPRSNEGIALYATGNVNMLQLSYAQAPAAVPSVGTTLSSLGIATGSGDSSTTSSTGYATYQDAIYGALAQTASNASGRYYTGVSSSGSNTTINESNFDSYVNSYYAPSVSVTYNGTTYSGSPSSVIQQLYYAGTGYSEPYGYNPVTSWINGSNSGFSGSGYYGNYQISTSKLDNYMLTGTTGSTGTTGTTGTTTATVQQTVLNQTFSGLVYAGSNLNFINGLGSVTLDGAAAAYGGNPNVAGAGNGSGGNITLSANSVSIVYDPSTLGQFVSFFGQQVQLQQILISNF